MKNPRSSGSIGCPQPRRDRCTRGGAGLLRCGRRGAKRLARCALFAVETDDVIGGPCVSFWDGPNGRHVSDFVRTEPSRRFRFLLFVGTGSLAVRRELFLSAGGLRSDWDCGEDVEFCWRLQLGGASLG